MSRQISRRTTNRVVEQFGEIVRACAFALTTAEFALARRLNPDIALDAIAAELDRALQGLGCDLRHVARLEARSRLRRSDN